MQLNVILHGDAKEQLATLPDESIDMVITSPPYWGLRDYGVEGQLGLEPEFKHYINDLCDIFDEVRRVLKPEGTCWVNLGDTYAGSGKGFGDEKHGKLGPKAKEFLGEPVRAAGVPAKSLVQIPSRFAIEMTDRGWILRNEIIWHKPNAMPQSVKDRFTVDFEKLFFFTKSKKYHFEQQLEQQAEATADRYKYGFGAPEKKQAVVATGKWHTGKGGRNNLSGDMELRDGRNKRSVWTIPTKPYADAHFATYPEALCETPIKAGCPEGGVVLDPFFGSGTTGLAALNLGRKFLGIELNPEYAAMAAKRLEPLLRQERLAV